MAASLSLDLPFMDRAHEQFTVLLKCVDEAGDAELCDSCLQARCTCVFAGISAECRDGSWPTEVKHNDEC